jgi:catechol 2,3-dioxygenase-like lactoylglutathione lyase family enzyme
MSLRIAQLTLTVRDYDEAIAFYTGKLGFELLEDTDLGNAKRWVRVRPAGSTGAGLLLARAVNEAQLASVGHQTGGRVFVFVETDDFDADYAKLCARGVSFVRGPTAEAYGKVAVFADLYGNLFDLIEPREATFAIDHVAFPCFDVASTHRFYTEVLGATLRHAQSGPAAVWNSEAYLLLAYELPGGVVLDFFSFVGITKPAGDGLPKDLRHVGLALPTRADVASIKARIEQASIPFWLETHDVDDVHVYVTDPNGVVLEILARRDGVGARAHDPEASRVVLEAWLAKRAG